MYYIDLPDELRYVGPDLPDQPGPGIEGRVLFGLQQMSGLARRMEEEVAARNWVAALYLVDSFKRFAAFDLVALLMTPDELRNTLATIWTSCDGIWRWRREALDYLREAGYIGSVPRPESELQLYRGVSTPAHRRGLSWSVHASIAQRFTSPFGRGCKEGGIVYTALVPPSAILAGFADREESEYVVGPARLPRLRRAKII